MYTEMEREQKSALDLCLRALLHMLLVGRDRALMTLCSPNKIGNAFLQLYLNYILFKRLEEAKVKRTWAEGEGGSSCDYFWLGILIVDRSSSS